tara:strand:- start:320 stop:1174 length:855 start_codon:yes stop_codon:yes gene_type:complete
MRILIAGCGYVGSELARQLHHAGHTVFGLRRDPSQLPEGITAIGADLGLPETLTELPEGIDFVFYTASATGYGEGPYRAAYVDGLQHLLNALKGQSPKRLFFTSSTGVYDQNDGEWVDEASPAAANRPTAQALRDGEALALGAAIPGTVVRFSGIYGPGRTRLIDSVIAGTARREGAETRYLNHIHRDDCAGCLAHLMSVEKPHDLYLATDSEPRTRNDFLSWIAEATHSPLPPLVDEKEENTRPSERGGNRRYRNDRLLNDGYTFRFPSYREGYGTLIAARNE